MVFVPIKCHSVSTPSKILYPFTIGKVYAEPGCEIRSILVFSLSLDLPGSPRLAMPHLIGHLLFFHLGSPLNSQPLTA